MRRGTLRIGLMVLLLFGLAVPAAADDESGAEVLVYESIDCNMAWYESGFDGNPAPILWRDCSAHNIETDNGGYRLVLHGTLPDEAMADFAADGYPRRYETGCLANFLFMAEIGFPPDQFEFTDSVRRYSPSGNFTEVCVLNPLNPFVGSWESIDPAPDDSHVRLQISNTGNWHLRDEAGMVCLNNGFEFVPATAKGTGQFTSTDMYQANAGDIYCYPRDSQGRQFVVTGPEVGYAYWPEPDVIIDEFGVCWWRTGTGDSSNCPA